VLNDGYASYANFFDPGVMYRAASGQPAGPPTGIVPGAPLGPFVAPSANQVDGWGVSGIIDYELSPNLSIKSITGYRKYFSQSGSDNDNSPIMMIQDNSKFFHNQFSQELRLSGKFVDDTVHFTLGGYYYDAATRYDARIHTAFSGFCPNATPCFSFINDDTASLTSYAGFANVAWDVTDRLSVEGGVRVTNEKKDYAFGRLNPDGLGVFLPLASLNNFVGKYKETITDFRAAASYKIADDKMIYAQFATGFKGGGIAPRPYNELQVRPFGAEKLKSYEIGFKADFLDRRVRVNGNVFYMDYKGYQGTPTICLDSNDQQLPPATRGPFCGQYLNIGDAEVKGFELEWTIKPVDGLTFDGSWSLTDFKFTSITYPTTTIRVGARRPGIGQWKWSAGAQYQANLGNLGTLTPRVDVAYTPGYCGDFDCFPNSKVEKYTLVNARLTFETLDKDWSLALEATNLFNKYYYLNKFVNAWYVDGQPGRPREVALTARRKF
jgi:iron complex outermembrane receptor protein